MNMLLSEYSIDNSPMNKIIISVIFLSYLSLSTHAQVTAPKFGKGLVNIMAADSTFSMKFGLRFQNLMVVTLTENEEGAFSDPQANFLIRRARFKFDGYAYSPKLKYKFEVGLSNRDQSGGGTTDFSNAPRYILDAFIEYNFYKNWYIKFGQGKLPGNRERVISSGNLQFVDRSRVNSRYNIDRDFGLFLTHINTFGKDFILKKIAVFSMGEGRNVTSGNRGGFDYTFRAEALPFGKFESKGDYVGSSIKRESSPKLSVGVSYDINVRAGKTRAQNGSFINVSDEENLKTLNTLFIDLMFKYQGLSIMAEYADKKAADDNPVVIEDFNEIATYYTGTGLNVQAGYMFDNNIELAARYTTITPDEVVDQGDKRYTLGLSKFIVGHKLKLQSDITFRDRETSSDQMIYRAQMDLHF